jgi:tRNA pseudouridine55 synthase
MENQIIVYKPVGLTPLAAINKFRQLYPAYKNEILSFAGRLDPMAEGVLILLVGRENKNRAKYLSFDKEYVFEIVFGFATDTFDAMGLVTRTSCPPDNLELRLSNLLSESIGETMQRFPPYSSKPVQGKPLFDWARSGLLSAIEIPSKLRIIYAMELLELKTIDKTDLFISIQSRLDSVEGDFRQAEIIARWEQILKNNHQTSFPKALIKITVSTGTYVRAIAEDLGLKLEAAAFALSIKRTRVGPFREGDSFYIGG